MRVGVRQRAQAVVVLLAGGIPQGELDALATDDDVGDAAGGVEEEAGSSAAGPSCRTQISPDALVFEDGRDVDL